MGEESAGDAGAGPRSGPRGRLLSGGRVVRLLHGEAVPALPVFGVVERGDGMNSMAASCPNRTTTLTRLEDNTKAI